MRHALLALSLAGAAAALGGGGDVLAARETGVDVLVSRLEPREGIETRSLHVVPLVCTEADARPGAPPLPPSATWQEAEAGRGFLDLCDSSGAVPADGAAVVPAGTLLLGGDRERVLELSEPHCDPRPRGLPARVCDVRTAPATSGARKLGPVAPMEQRKLLLLGETGDAWSLLLRIQQVVVGTPEGSETLSDLLDVEWLRQRASETEAVLQRIPPAYAGRTRGHVAFFGYRPVEVVLARTPADYRALGSRLMRSLAVSHAIWERALGLEEKAWDGVPAHDFLPPAARAVSEIAQVKPRRVSRLIGEKHAWEHARGRVLGIGGTDRFVIGLTTVPGEGVLLLEAIEDGDRTIHPLPLRSPGGRAVDEGPDIRGGGLTEGYLRRLMERRAAREGR